MHRSIIGNKLLYVSHYYTYAYNEQNSAETIPFRRDPNNSFILA